MKIAIRSNDEKEMQVYSSNEIFIDLINNIRGFNIERHSTNFDENFVNENYNIIQQIKFRPFTFWPSILQYIETAEKEKAVIKIKEKLNSGFYRILYYIILY